MSKYNLTIIDFQLALEELENEEKVVTRLHLAHQGLQDSRMWVLLNALDCGRYMSLTHLFLNSNKIGPVGADALAEVLRIPLVPLQVLCLPGNTLGDEGALSLFESLSGNSSLVELCLQDNHLKDATLNGISLLGTSALTRLDISYNLFSDEGFRAAELEMSNMRLCTINLQKSLKPSVGREPAGLELVQFLKSFSVLTVLKLHRNRLSTEACTKLSELIGMKSLMSLNMKLTNMSSSGTTELVSSLPGSSMTNLDISSNSIGDEGLNDVAKAIATGQTAIEFLNLSTNGITIYGIQALSAALEDNTTLVELDLSNNRLGSSGAGVLAGALMTRSSEMRVLRMSGCGIGDDGAERLSELVATNPKLEELKLARNGIGVSGARALALGLLTNRTIASLDVCDNKMRDDGVIAIADAIRMQGDECGVVFLNISENEDGLAGAESLGKLVEESTSLNGLSFGSEQYDGNCVEVLGEGLKKNYYSITTFICATPSAEERAGIDLMDEIDSIIMRNRVIHDIWKRMSLLMVSLRRNRVIRAPELLERNCLLMILDYSETTVSPRGADFEVPSIIRPQQ